MHIRPGPSDRRKLVRAFIAVDINPGVKRTLRSAVAKLKRRTLGSNVRWVPEENWHITVKFMGEVEWLAVGVLGKAMKEAAKSVSAFDLELLGLRPFPPDRNPRIIVAEFGSGSDELMALHTAMDSCMQELGADPENRTFRAHLTLARLRGIKDTDPFWESFEPFVEQGFGSTEVDEVVMYQSEFRRGGAEYTRLASGSLGL